MYVGLTAGEGLKKVIRMVQALAEGRGTAERQHGKILRDVSFESAAA